MKRWLWTRRDRRCAGAMPARVGAQNNADIDGGRLLFQGMCVECHGAGGTGGDAPSLNRPRLQHAPDRCRAGQRDSEWHPEYRDAAHPPVHRKRAAAARRVRAIAREAVDRNAFRATPKKGAAIYKNLACASLPHRRRRGRQPRADLTDIGFMRGAAYLREAVVDPGAALPKGTLSVLSRGYAEYLPAAHRHQPGRRSPRDPGQRRCVHAFRCATRPASSTRCGRATSSCWRSRQGRA